MSDSSASDHKLWKAAEAGDDALVSQFIEQGAEVDWRYEYGFTALHAAAGEGHTHVVTLLLNAGWSLEGRVETETMQKQEQGQGMTLSELEELVEETVMASRFGATPLSLAVQNGHMETAKCLLLRGARIETENYRDGTPLQKAATRGHNELPLR